jgi:hypothetical protein
VYCWGFSAVKAFLSRFLDQATLSVSQHFLTSRHCLLHPAKPTRQQRRANHSDRLSSEAPHLRWGNGLIIIQKTFWLSKGKALTICNGEGSRENDTLEGATRMYVLSFLPLVRQSPRSMASNPQVQHGTSFYKKSCGNIDIPTSEAGLVTCSLMFRPYADKRCKRLSSEWQLCGGETGW